MTKEQRELLLQDLSARLPYGLKCYIPEGNDTSILGAIQEDGENTLFDFWEDGRKIQFLHQLYISEFKPYLFPLSSMNEEQRKEFELISDLSYASAYGEEIVYSIKIIDFFNKNHFDYRGLIEQGLALDAIGKNIY